MTTRREVIRLSNEEIKALESVEEYGQRWLSIRIIYFTMFLMSLGFSVVLTGVWPYLDKLDPTAGKEFMGYVVAANPFAQMLFSPLVGWWGNRLGSVRFPLITSLVIFIASSAAYSSLELISEHRKYWMLASRFFVGVSSATKLEERTGAVSMVSLAQVLGFIVGPGLQAAVTPLGNDGFILIKDVLTLNMYTAAGWINVLLGILNLLLFFPLVFKERSIAAKEAMILSGAETEKAAWKGCKPDYVSAWTMIVAFFILVFNFVLLETLGTSLTMDQFAWSKSQALYYIGLLLSIGALLACITFAVIGPLCKRFDEGRVLLWGGFLLMVVGRALYIPWGSSPPLIAQSQKGIMDGNSTHPTLLNSTVSTFFNANQSDSEENEFLGCPPSQKWCHYTPAMTVEQFLIGFVLTAIGYPIGVTLIQTIFSKILGPRPQGVWMGLMTGAGCLSRVMGPVFVSLIYTRLGTIWTFSITAAMMALAMVWLQLVLKRLKLSYELMGSAVSKEKRDSGDARQLNVATVSRDATIKERHSGSVISLELLSV